MKPSLFRKTLLASALSLLLAALIFGGFALWLSDRLAVESQASSLLRTASVSAELLTTMFGPAGSRTTQAASPPWSDWASRLAVIAGCRVTIIDGSGKVKADSSAEASSMENHGSRAEVAKALKGEAAWSLRVSSTTGKRTLYAAVPLSAPSGFVLRLALPLPSVLGRLSESRWLLLLLFIFLGLAAVIVSALQSRGISKPISYLTEKAEAYAGNGKAPEPGKSVVPHELKILDDSLDSLVAGIRTRTAEAENLGRRLSSILEAAGEGIVAVDASLRILEANSAAALLFGVAKDDLRGKTALEALRNKEAADFLSGCLESGQEAYRTIRVFEGGDRYLKAHATRFTQGAGPTIVAVFSDISELVRLGTVRKEFVANVSHELRTPVQIVRGYAELLSSGGLDRETGERYAALIEKTALRMERIVADLLMLARLENDPDPRSRLEPCELGPILDAALSLVEASAARKHIKIEVETASPLDLVASPGLLEQAVFNLLDNAVNYSSEGSTVKLTAKLSEADWIQVEVSDQGIGIPQAELGRIFERFYRVDKSRNKATGGTGLGLAIVKHIAEVHGGSVAARSFLDEGTTFTLSIPKAGPSRPSQPSLARTV
jgi:two-component system, OmpR family, phosphate regulon sensor histidine kinase PhoR